MAQAADNLKFNLDLWPDSILSLDFAVAPSVLGPYLSSAPGDPGAGEYGGSDSAAPELATSVRGHLDLRLSGKRLFVKGVFAAKERLICSRCLSPFVARIGDQIDEILEIGEPAELGAAEDPGFFIPVKNREIDLMPLLAELFWLAQPLRNLCSPDCRGLCPVCGANLNDGPCSCGGAHSTRH